MELLTNLNNLKAWLGDPASNTTDALLTRLIAQSSGFILNFTNRASFFKTSFEDYYSGFGGSSLTLDNWPVTSVESVVINGQSIPAGTPVPVQSSGFYFNLWNGRGTGGAQNLALRGYSFTRGVQNVKVNYTGGYFTTNEAQSVPSASPYEITALQSLGTFGRNDGVTLANGTALTYTASATPLAGQYTVDAYGKYTFNSAQAGVAVLLSYSWILPEIEQACIEIAAERYRYSKRIGQQSISAGGQVTTTFSLKSLPDYVNDTLQNYKRWGY